MNITIKWTAFKEHEFMLAEQGKIGNAEMNFEVPTDHYQIEGNDFEWLNYLYECTNLHQGKMWNTYFDGKMPENRSHTSLSVGDQIVLDGREYVCEMVGWSLVNK